MAQRPNNTDLPPKETTQPLKGKGPHQQNDPGDWESQEREPWANAMECVQGQAQMYCYPRVVFEVFEPHVYTPLTSPAALSCAAGRRDWGSPTNVRCSVTIETAKGPAATSGATQGCRWPVQ
ncbi:uncharacterized protein ATNIH1004_002046 [Aspergillus tanneri]|uniref:Uncharacterized protein n=1 Tax=Aspergillus tanneri TaxID=1220188 RepID=A0A5M9M6V3_9EURO|nr:uncharacterized protein ATNIH1004_002046 [Aspergillus tanneri]KAA8641306.1 hypothetical protein ATNIH1004_002046 [Aspergillus tanneri]